ncbi:MAG: hypothetical protein GOV01_02010 [Candidatus Altiarchaeota archaeon]|nr:hypothetical protein [Candidatus Altiarchaeota archaeon]
MKGISELVGNVLMLLVVTGLISEAFLYGMPILRKRMDQATISYIEDALADLANAMESTAQNGGETSVRLESQSRFSNPPEIKITQDSLGYYLELRSAAQVAHYAPFDVPLNDFIEPVKSGELIMGTLGVNKGAVVTGRSSKLSGGIRNVMTLRTRPIRDAAKDVLTLIEITPARGKSTKTILPTSVYLSKSGERLESVLESNQTVTYNIITLEVGFE